jgi:hypothetical protein
MSGETTELVHIELLASITFCRNSRTRSFLMRYTSCNVCIATGTNVYVSSCKSDGEVPQE